MKILRSLLAMALLVLACLSTAHAGNSAMGLPCITESVPVTINYGTGNISISYQLCPTNANYTSFDWDGTITYNNVNWGEGFSINGNMSIQLIFANDALTTISFTGGPLTYDIRGVMYTVTFNNLAFSFNNQFSVVSATGSLVINGQTVNADAAYWPFLFH